MSAVRTLPQAASFFVRQPSVQLLLAVALAVLALRAHAGAFNTLDLLVPLAVLLVWPFNEWLIHVFVLHARPLAFAGHTLDLPVARKHRAHHRDPTNLEILFIPLGSFLVSLPLVAGLSFALAPTHAIALTAVLTIVCFGLHYEWIHFLAHTSLTPRNPVYAEVIRRHRLHHYKNEKLWFGVSILGADRVLGTSPDPDQVPRSPTARRLHEELEAPV